MPPDFVVVGHLRQDLVRGAHSRLGGVAAYAALAAHRLGRRVGLVTSASLDLPLEELSQGIEVAMVPAEHTTTFRYEHAPQDQLQYVEAVATPLPLSHVPWPWLDTQILLAAPLLGEIDPTMLGRFRKSLIGAVARGWLQRWAGPHSPLQKQGLDSLSSLPPLGALFLSEEDYQEKPEELASALGRTPIGVIAPNAKGAQLWWGGRWENIPAYSTLQVDPTDVSGVFAAAFLVRLSESRDPFTAALFASVAAALSVEHQGLSGVPTRAEVEKMLEKA